MNEFRRDLDKAKTDENLRAVFKILRKATTAVPDQFTAGEIRLVRNKEEALRKDCDLDIDFDFQFKDARTENEVEAEVARLRAGNNQGEPDMHFTAEVWDNPDRIFRVRAHRVYYNKNIFKPTPEVRQAAPVWTPAAQQYQVDITGEINSTIFLKHEEISDYEATLINLKKLAQARTYTDASMKDCITRLASHYDGYHPSTFDNMDSNEVAKMLLRSQSKINKKCYFRMQLENEKRSKKETLANAFTRAEALIRKIYPGNGDEETKKNLLMQALVSYSPDPMSDKLDKEFHQAKLKGEENEVYEALKSLTKKELVREYVVKEDRPFAKKSKISSQYTMVFNIEPKMTKDMRPNFKKPYNGKIEKFPWRRMCGDRELEV